MKGSGTCACGRISGRLKRGMCSRCYDRWRYRRTEDERRRPTVRERFEAKYIKGAPDECWNWTGSHNKSGHGDFHVSVARGKVKAQSFALELATGIPCPPGKGGCHRCDNPPCVNPAHIYYGTQLENAADMVARKRMPIGEARPNAKLLPEQIVDIRERFAGGETMTSIRADYGLSSGKVSRIVNGVDWKHVGGPIKTHNKPGRRSNKDREARERAA